MVVRAPFNSAPTSDGILCRAHVSFTVALETLVELRQFSEAMDVLANYMRVPSALDRLNDALSPRGVNLQCSAWTEHRQQYDGAAEVAHTLYLYLLERAVASGVLQ